MFLPEALRDGGLSALQLLAGMEEVAIKQDLQRVRIKDGTVGGRQLWQLPVVPLPSIRDGCSRRFLLMSSI